MRRPINSKFKDKCLWNLNKKYEWSSQPIDSIASSVWTKDGIGRTVGVMLRTSYLSTLGYDYEVDSIRTSSRFKMGAFEKSERLRTYLH